MRVLGLEIDPQRVAAARELSIAGCLEFGRGGFELAGTAPVLVRAANVLRQYDETQVAQAWQRMCQQLAPDGLIIEGTCDELGRIAAWVLLDATGPQTLTLAADVATLDSPAVLAQRLPKALIHRNIAGEPVHAFISALDTAWRNAAPFAVFGPRDRWRRSLNSLLDSGWPIREPPARRRDGTVTVDWELVAPKRFDVTTSGHAR